MSVHKCCVPNCDNSRSNNTIMHLFPNPNLDMERFRTWIYAVGGDILALENSVIFKLRRICHEHFESKYLTRSNRLAANAVPTLNLPGFSISKSLPLKNITNTLCNLENVETDHQSTSKANNDKTSTKQPVLDGFPSTSKFNIESMELVQSTSKASIEKVENKSTDSPVLKGAKNLPLSERYSNEASWLQKKLHKLQLSKNSMVTRLKKALKLSENATFQKAVSKGG
ncbi:unnamed protein product [Arctia plantaginis]|uniref:THAP-type domain-containing protein n=1 Tax=Arctia plantaginis TaxID=874455 RepID=A0A8S1B2Z8_ARCPL|nr:unnamed protein product [Arctia plantaginis]